MVDTVFAGTGTTAVSCLAYSLNRQYGQMQSIK